MSEVIFRRLEDIHPTKDWRKRIDAMKDVDIDYSDIPQLDDNFPLKAVRGRLYRPIKKTVTLRLDADVLAWLKSQGTGYQARINTALRNLMLSQNSKHNALRAA